MIYGHSECLHAALAGVSDYHEKILYLTRSPISGGVLYSSATYTQINTVLEPDSLFCGKWRKISKSQGWLDLHQIMPNIKLAQVIFIY